MAAAAAVRDLLRAEAAEAAAVAAALAAMHAALEDPARTGPLLAQLIVPKTELVGGLDDHYIGDSKRQVLVVVVGVNVEGRRVDCWCCEPASVAGLHPPANELALQRWETGITLDGQRDPTVLVPALVRREFHLPDTVKGDDIVVCASSDQVAAAAKAEASLARERPAWGPSNGAVPDDYAERIVAIVTSLNAEPLVHRIAGDWDASFGDGGFLKMTYPGYVAPRLSVLPGAASGVSASAGAEAGDGGVFTSAKRERLTTLLRELSDARKDRHSMEPVTDIIDPNLAPRKLLGDRGDYVMTRIRDLLWGALRSGSFEGAPTTVGELNAACYESSAEQLYALIRRLWPHPDASESSTLQYFWAWMSGGGTASSGGDDIMDVSRIHLAGVLGLPLQAPAAGGSDAASTPMATWLAGESIPRDYAAINAAAAAYCSAHGLMYDVYDDDDDDAMNYLVPEWGRPLARLVQQAARGRFVSPLDPPVEEGVTGEPHEPTAKVGEGTCVRASIQWIPVDVSFDTRAGGFGGASSASTAGTGTGAGARAATTGPGDGTARRPATATSSDYVTGRASFAEGHTGQIHNLGPRSDHAELYSLLEDLLSAMVPLLAEVGLLEDDEVAVRQVVVKAQEYELRPGMSYSGSWHTEGATEHIVAAATYYCHVDEGLKGGNLKFRPSEVPGNEYEYTVDREVEVAQDTAVVFSNVLPHRFRRLSYPRSAAAASATTAPSAPAVGASSGAGAAATAAAAAAAAPAAAPPKRRVFVNFFFVDPMRPIVTDPSVETTITALRETLRGKGVSLPRPVVSLVEAFINEAGWHSMEEARAFRETMRSKLAACKAGWGYINYGNCGQVEFIRELAEKGSEAREYGMQPATDSGSA